VFSTLDLPAVADAFVRSVLVIPRIGSGLRRASAPLPSSPFALFFWPFCDAEPFSFPRSPATAAFFFSRVYSVSPFFEPAAEICACCL